MRVATIALAMLVVFGTAVAGEKSRDVMATQIRVLNNSAIMMEHDVRLLTTIFRHVGKQGIPDVISKGDQITVKGKTVTANIIQVKFILEDMSYAGEVFARKGDVLCTVASTPEDMPWGEERDRLWINVEQSAPIQ